MTKVTGNDEVLKDISFADEQVVRTLSGIEHEILRIIAKIFAIRIGARGNTISLRGDKKAVNKAQELLSHLGHMVLEGRQIALGDVRNAALRMNRDRSAKVNDFFQNHLLKTKNSHEVRPRGPGQKAYVDAITNHDLVMGVGPAGTGKTYLAMTAAVLDLLAGRVNRIILTRPAVEAGEKLGFLPGNLEEKVSPYLRPLYDALFDLVGTEKAEEWVERAVIEVAPLAFMRGRTLNDAFVILDEAQNTTPEQMKMALTRLGFGSKMVVTGDVTQIDLAANQPSGLIEAIKLLEKVPGVAVCTFSENDVVRHPLVQSIIRAYEGARQKDTRGH